jgi:hypothetical protein
MYRLPATLWLTAVRYQSHAASCILICCCGAHPNGATVVPSMARGSLLVVATVAMVFFLFDFLRSELFNRFDALANPPAPPTVQTAEY